MKNREIMVGDNKWVRSTDGWFAGVCQGLGERFDIEPNLLRLLWVVSIVFFGVGLLVYIGLALTLPREDQLYKADEEKFLGVCARISRKSSMDVGLVRFLCLALGVTSFGATVVGYFVLYLLLPAEEDVSVQESRIN